MDQEIISVKINYYKEEDTMSKTTTENGMKIEYDTTTNSFTESNINNSNSKINLHKEICNKIHETYKKKNHDYGDSFGRSFAKRGIVAAMVRLEDKWNRLDNLTLNPNNVQVNDESIEDTFLDMANYCIMTYMELKMKGNE